MLYRLLWHTAHYRIPEVLALTVLECAIVLGVDQHHKPNLPFGMERPDMSGAIEDAMLTPTSVMIMDPAQLQSVMAFQVAQP